MNCAVVFFWVCVLVIICLGSFIAYLFYKLALKRRRTFVFIGFSLFVLGAIVYGAHGYATCHKCIIRDRIPSTPNPAKCAIAAVNESLSSFFPSRGSYDDGEDDIEKPLLYWCYHYLVFIYILSIGTAVFGVELMNRFSVWRKCLRIPRLKVVFEKDQGLELINVFWGVCPEARMMCAQMMTDEDCKSDSCVFVLPYASRSWMRMKDDDHAAHELTRNGIKWVVGDVAQPGFLRSAKRHFFLSADGHANVAKAETLMNALKKDCGGSGGKQCGEISIYVRTWAEADDDAVYKWADNWNQDMAKRGISVEIVREESIVSRKFLLDYPMLNCPNIQVDTNNVSVSGNFRVLVLGFGVQGERLMSDLVCDAQYLDSNGKPIPILVDVVDSDQTSFGWFKENCTEACKRYSIHFHELDIRSASFWQWLKEEGRQPYNRIIISTQDDVVNLEAANDVANLYGTLFGYTAENRRKIVFVRVRNQTMGQALASSDKPYTIFGDISDTYSPAALLNDRWNDGARILNGIYCAGGIDAHRSVSWEDDARCWSGTNTFDRESTKASLFNQRNILRLLGFEVDANRKGAGRQVPDRIVDEILGKERQFMVTLAETEHRRWMAFHFVRGWERWNPGSGLPPADVLDRIAGGIFEANATKAEKDKKGLEINTLKKKGYRLHAALADFADLDKVDAMFKSMNERYGLPISKKTTKSKDDDLVYGIEAVKEAKFCIAKSV